MINSTHSKEAHIELVSIYFIVFGISILFSINTAFLGGTKEITYSDNTLGYLIGTELITGAIALIILKYRGWSYRDFNLKISPLQAFFGMLIFALDYIIYYSTAITLKILGLFKSSELLISDISIFTALITSAINPLFEEFFVVAYTIERIEDLHGKFFAIVLSAFVRFLYHMYQGPLSIWIFVLGLAHGFIYIKWRKLWPLVIGHGILNFIAFNT